jgi:hypothetical protein
MKPFVFLACLFLFFSCREKAGNAVANAVAGPVHDSASLVSDSGKVVFIERAGGQVANYIISVRTKFLLPDTLSEDSSYYSKGSFLFVYDKNRHSTDTLPLASDPTPVDFELQDVSDSLHFKTLVLDIGWSGDSDMRINEFVEYNNHRLTELFSIDELESLQRINEQTFSGFMSSRDELVENVQHDYPFTVSLKDHEVRMEKPPKQYIGFSSKAFATIKRYRVSAQNDTVGYTIKKGTALTVDTLYRVQGLVRLIVSDSIIVQAPVRNLSNKLQHNAAG